MRKLFKHILTLALESASVGSAAIAGSRAEAGSRPTPYGWTKSLTSFISNEQHLYGQMHNYSPLVETYIQNLRPDKDLGQGFRLATNIFSDALNFAKGVALVPLTDTSSKGKKVVGSIGNFFSFSMQFLPDGFLQMIFIDTNGFDKQHYKFDYVRREFLG